MVSVYLGGVSEWVSLILSRRLYRYEWIVMQMGDAIRGGRCNKIEEIEDVLRLVHSSAMLVVYRLLRYWRI